MNKAPLRPLREREVRTFEEDGVVLLSGMLDEDWLDLVSEAIERDIANPGPGYHGYETDDGKGRFHGNFDLWRVDEGFADYCLNSPLPALAAQMMRSEKVQVFYDQLFVKEADTASPTPWHNDQPYWPISGWRAMSFWLALDPVTEDSGALEFIRGSHKWDRWFQPRTFAEGGYQYEENPAYEPIPDFDGQREKHEIVTSDMQPGDLFAFHALAVHGAGGNRRSDVRRRGYTVRYIGDGVTYDDRKGTNPSLRRDDQRPGGPLDPSTYPVVWPDKQPA